MVLIRSHDGLFRYVFGDPEQMAELLRAMLPSPIAAAIDWRTLARVDGTFVDQALQDRITDLLFTAQVHGAPVLLHLVVDHKSADDPFACLQMARYALRIHDRWLLDHPGARSLPPILAFVVHHGDKPWRSKRSVDELVDLTPHGPEVAAFLQPFQLRMPFVLLDLATMDEDALTGLRLSIVADLTLRFLQFLRGLPPAAAIEHIVRWQRLVTTLLQHRRGKDVVMALFSWFLAGAPESHQTLRKVMNRIDETNVPMRSALDLLLDMGHERGHQVGLREGLQQGFERGRQELRTAITARLAHRFGELPPAWCDRLAAADLDTLLAWHERMVTATRLDDLLAP